MKDVQDALSIAERVNKLEEQVGIQQTTIRLFAAELVLQARINLNHIQRITALEAALEASRRPEICTEEPR